LRPPCADDATPGPPVASIAVGVGNNPHPVPPMVGANIVRSQHAPRRIVPERGQVAENSAESPSSEGWAVFHERETGSNLANDPSVLGPKPGLWAVDSGAAPGDRDVRAWPATADDVGDSSPRSPVEFAGVPEYGEPFEGAVCLPSGEHALAVLVDLDCADGADSEHTVGEDSAASPCKKVKSSESVQLIGLLIWQHLRTS